MNTIKLNTIGILSGGGNAGGGGGGVTINNQEKSVDITENGTIEVVADAGFTGLGKITINVNVPTGTPTYENGVYVQHIDSKLYTTDEWTAKGFANEDANGVAVIANEASFVCNFRNLSYGTLQWLGTPALIEGIAQAATVNDAVLDFQGLNNTQLMIAAGSSAATTAAGYTSPNGKQGYLPSLGEWSIYGDNLEDIIVAMTAIGLNAITSDYYLSSTQKNASDCWQYGAKYGKKEAYGKTSWQRVAAFFPL